MQLVANNAHIWLDHWELNVGDSIVQRVQDAITTSSALIIVLSKASVTSEWCKKELNVGIIRELEEKRVIVLPLLLEDCEIPIFLKDKMYADFRTYPEEGLRRVLEAIASVTNSDQGRIEIVEGFLDWSVDWGLIGENFKQRFTIIQTSTNLPMTFLTEISINYNEAATRRYKQYLDSGLDWIGRRMVGELLFDLGKEQNLRFKLQDQFEQHSFFKISDTGGSDLVHEVIISCRRLGQDTGKAQLVNISEYLTQIRHYINSVSRKASTEELMRMAKIIATPL
jgi:hypothetical protein